MSYLIENKRVPSTLKTYLNALRPKEILTDDEGKRITPSLTSTLYRYSIDDAELDRYLTCCGFDSKQTKVPSTYLQVVSAPLHLQIVMHQGFPFPPFGMVHVRNKITSLREIERTEKLYIISKLEETDELRSGIEGVLSTTIYSLGTLDDGHILSNSTQMALKEQEESGEKVWYSELTFLIPKRQEKEPIEGDLTKKEAMKKTGGEGFENLDTADLLETQFWDLPSNLGRRYAKISRDYNPIHLTSLTAKVFGYSHAIAHGMWAQGHILATIKKHIPVDTSYELSISFRRPIFLPSVPQFELYNIVSTDPSLKYVLKNASNGKHYLHGEFKPIIPSFSV